MRVLTLQKLMTCAIVLCVAGCHTTSGFDPCVHVTCDDGWCELGDGGRPYCVCETGHHAEGWTCVPDGSDADADADSEIDVESESDADADIDADSDIDVEVDADSDSDEEADGDIDADSDFDVDADADGDIDADSDIDVEVDADSDSDEEADADLEDAGADGDVEGDAEAETDGDVGHECTATVGESESIQESIEAAEEGATICVEPGTYTESLDFGGRAIRVVGLEGPGATTIHGGGVGPVVNFANGETSDSVLEGFTIRGGVYEVGTRGDRNGGAGVRISKASPTLRRLVIRDNEVLDGCGGGIFADESAADIAYVDVIDNTDNRGSGGAGMCLRNWDGPTIMHLNISKNRSTGSGHGLHIVGGAVTLSNASITENSGNNMTIYINNASLALRNVLISKNTSDSDVIQVSTSKRVEMRNVIISRNESSSANTVLFANASADLANVTFVGNVASRTSGSSGIRWSFSNVSLKNVSLSEGNGGHAALYRALSRDDDVTLIANCNVYDNLGGDYGDELGDLTGEDGNISEDPNFLDTSVPIFGEDPWEWDLHLDTGSELVDAGDPGEGLWDPDRSRSDIGAYGGPGAASWDLDWDGYPEWYQPGEYDYDSYPAEDLDCDDRDPSFTPRSGCSAE